MRPHKIFLKLLFISATVFVLVACNGRGSDNSNRGLSAEVQNDIYNSPSPTYIVIPTPVVRATPISSPPANYNSAVSSTATNGNTNQVTNQRIILKSAELTLTIETPAKSIQEITQLAESNGGWVVSSQVFTTNNMMTGEITIRIPAEIFTMTIETIKQSAIQVNTEIVRGQDVTQDYTDLESQLTNLELAEEQIQSFLELAEDTDAVLRVHDRLVNVHGQIETARGRLRYYSESAAYSSVRVTLRQPEPKPEIIEEKSEPKKEEESWQPLKTLEDAVGSSLATLQYGADILIWSAGYLLPIGLTFTFFVTPLWLRWRYKRQHRRTQQTMSSQESVPKQE